MTVQQRAQRIAADLDELALSFLLDGRRIAAYKVISISCDLIGEERFEGDSPMAVAEQMANAEGGAV